MRKAVVTLSGGADSATVLYLALRECDEVHAISVNYGQRHRRELTSAKALCAHVKVKHVIVDFPALGSFGGSPLVDTTVEVPSQKDMQQSSTVVPYRNTFLITLAAAYAHSVGFNVVYAGPTYEDLANYPDCRPEYIDALQKALRLGGTIHELEICTPFITTTKDKVVEIGIQLGVPYAYTWTCYKGGEYPCLECDACRERMASFKKNGISDPLLCETDWKKYLTEVK